MEDRETPLAGGRVTTGVVRLGDTVRRPVSADRTCQRALLRHLESKVFVGAPRFLGVDEQGREILTHIAGDVPSDLGHYDDAQLDAAARLLRLFHDATTDFAPVREAAAEVMCHNDWGPCNTVFRDGVPFALIDFDTIAPGPRLSDLGYAAWLWLDLGNREYAGDEQLRRLGVFAAAYDAKLCAEAVVPFVLSRQHALAASAQTRGLDELAAWAGESADWTMSNLGS